MDVFGKLLKKEWIDDALRITGRAGQRQRELPAPLTLWLVVAMAFYRKLSIRNVLAQLGNILGVGSLWEDGDVPESSSIVEARNRLGFRPLRWLADRFAGYLRETYREALAFKGLLVAALDGSTLKVPDSPENRRRFGLPGSSRGRAAFPQMRALFLVSVRFHFILKALFAPYHRGEMGLAWRMLWSIPEGLLLLVDRGFCAWWFLFGILDRRSHFLVRAKSNMSGRRFRRLGRGDWLVEVTMPRKVRRLFPGSSRHLVLRELTIRVRGRWYRFLTSLTDAEIYPAEELLSLYRERWEEELVLDEIKTHQVGATTVNRPVIFRSKTTRRVLQEAYGLVLAFNLVRSLMARAAQRAQVSPLRISFVDSLERIRVAAIRMAAASPCAQEAIYEDLLESLSRCVLPRRRLRMNRREVCVKMSSYPLKKKPA
jgi:hypothetical protein